MKVLILAGGFGTRISEESGIRPKPMVEIGERPILWHLMKIYSHYGFNDFIILLGYKGHVIKEYFSNYFLNNSSVTIDLKNNTIQTLKNNVEPWKITLLDTGIETQTGGRILHAKDLVDNGTFMLTYGDGLSNVNISSLIEHHKKSKKTITMTAVQPSNKFGTLSIANDGEVMAFKEKPKDENGWINGGFFVCEPKVFDYIKEGDQSIFERSPLESLVNDRQLNCYTHPGFWKCMDTLGDKNTLNKLWNNGEAEWKVW